MHDQIFSGTGCQNYVVADLPCARPLNRPLLKRKRAERNIHIRVFQILAGLSQQNPVAQGKLTSVGTTRIEVLQESVNELLLLSKTRQKCKINILCKSWISPTLGSHAADEAKFPRMASEGAFKLCRSNQ